MMDKKVVDLRHSHIKSAMERLVEVNNQEGLTMLTVVGITKAGEILSLFAHDGDPAPYTLLGAVEENKKGILDWMAEQG